MNHVERHRHPWAYRLTNCHGAAEYCILAVAVWLLVKPQKNSESWFWPLLLLLDWPPSLVLLSVSFRTYACDHHGCYGRIEVWCSTRHFFAILVTLASNAVLGHGWWSLFQMIAWGSVAAVASVVNVYDQEEIFR